MTNRLTKTALAVLLLGTLNATAWRQHRRKARISCRIWAPPPAAPEHRTRAGDGRFLRAPTARQRPADQRSAAEPVHQPVGQPAGGQRLFGAHAVPFLSGAQRRDQRLRLLRRQRGAALRAAARQRQRKPAGFGAGTRNLARHPAPPGARNGRSAAQRPADLGGRARLHPAGDGQPDYGHGGAERHWPAPSRA